MTDPFSFGEKFRIRLFGSSHGQSVGVEIEGCPKGLEITADEIQLWLDRRKPGGELASGRKESDKLLIESGIRDGKATGGKIRLLVENKDARASDYKTFENLPRPGHADYTSKIKFGKVESGGGVFSGRMTAGLVMAGAVAKKILAKRNIKTMAHATRIGGVWARAGMPDCDVEKKAYSNVVRVADDGAVALMRQEIENAARTGDSVGGIVECRINGVPPGIGGPLFSSIEGNVAIAVFAIPAVKGVEFGSGFACAGMKGSQHNDEFCIRDGKVATRTNNAGGILGGITDGMPIVFQVAFKPTASIFKEQTTVNLEKMKEEKITISGRHDPCIAIRAVPVVENIAAICIADMLISEEEERKKGGKHEA